MATGSPRIPASKQPPMGALYAVNRDTDTMSVFSDTATLRSDSEENGGTGPYYKPLGRRNGVAKHGRTTSSASSINSEYAISKSIPAVPREPHRLAQSRQPSEERHSFDAEPQETPLQALESAIGTDNTPHTTELDTIPCAGIRIPQGAFQGLLAWRFVVRIPKDDLAKYRSRGARRERSPSPAPPLTGPLLRGASSNGLEDGTLRRPQMPRRKSTEMIDWKLYEPSRPFAQGQGAGPYQHGRARSQVDLNDVSSVLPTNGHSRKFQPSNGHVSSSSLHLPAPHSAMASMYDGTGPDALRPSSAFSFYPASAYSMQTGNTPMLTPTPTIIPEAIVTNFILDTSSSHNTISRETLMALGVNESLIESLEAAVDADGTNNSGWGGSLRNREQAIAVIALNLQNISKPITFRLAPEGQPGRLGVQFLEEARVNVCIGEGGRGGIVWADPSPGADGFLGKVPRTIPLPKATLQAKVLAFFGLDA